MIDAPDLPDLPGNRVDVADVLAAGADGAHLLVALRPRSREPAAPAYNLATRTPDGAWRCARVAPRDGTGTPRLDALTHQPGPESDVGIVYVLFRGNTIARSVDGCRSAELVHGDGTPSVHSPWVILAHGDVLWTGQEEPLDEANLSWADIRRRGMTPVPLALHRTRGGLDLSNRRPNCLVPSPVRSDVAYAGLEGAIARFTFDGRALTGSWIQQWSSGGDGDAVYPYVQGIWVDPADPDHVVIGGFDKARANAPLALLEVAEGQAAPVKLPTPAPQTRAYVPAMVPLDGGARCLLLVGPALGERGPSAVFEATWVR
jgi:hypothetical protein